MEWALIAGWILVGGLGLVFLGMAATFVFEREWRAFSRTWVLALPVLAVWTLPLLVDFPGRVWVVWALMGVALLTVLALILPLGSSRAGLQVVGSRTRVDERDALFHRFYRLVEGSPEYRAFYDSYPGLEASDTKLRALPGLGHPGSRHYHPHTSAYMRALFDLSCQVGRIADEVVPPLEPEPVPGTPGDFTKRLLGLARHMGAHVVGCTRLEPEDVYSHVGRGPGEWGSPIELPHSWAIAIGVEMDWDLHRHAPATASTTETAARYLDGAVIAGALARVIQYWGYSARPHVDGNYRVLCGPIAERAGLGETARSGLLVVPGCGPRVRLSVVTTDLELEDQAGGPPRLGVQDFCSFCAKCASNCPSGAVDEGEPGVHAGVRKWKSDMEACHRMWRSLGTDCGLCIKVCPFAKPDSPLHRVVRWCIAHNSLARRLSLWADDFLYGARPGARYPLPAWHEEDEPAGTLDPPASP